jgi:hypothetical protein
MILCITALKTDMLTVIMPSVIMIIVANKPIMLSVVILNVVAPIKVRLHSRAVIRKSATKK